MWDMVFSKPRQVKRQDRRAYGNRKSTLTQKLKFQKFTNVNKKFVYFFYKLYVNEQQQHKHIIYSVSCNTNEETFFLITTTATIIISVGEEKKKLIAFAALLW